MGYASYWESPLGWIEVKDDGQAINEIAFAESLKSNGKATELGSHMISELQLYFSGKLTEFSSSLKPKGTEFQMKVWDELRQIPFGETMSYGQLATKLGDSNLSRAVGLANGKNPIAIVIPCHRVIGSDGSLTGYASGLDRKKALLQIEGKEFQLELF